jgi:sugar porter (SP) family MFS transporter
MRPLSLARGCARFAKPPRFASRLNRRRDAADTTVRRERKILTNKRTIAEREGLRLEPGTYGVLVTLVAAIGGLLFGFDTGVISGAIIFITPQFALGDVAVGILVSAVTLGALLGALMAGAAADRFGPRLTLIAGGALFVAGALASAFAGTMTVLLAARLVIGVAIGLTSVTAPIYIAETARAAIRGRLVSLYQFAITVGILVSYLCDDALARRGAWRWMLGLGALPGAALLLGMLPMPESPRWLWRRGERAAARAVLLKLRAVAEFESEQAAIARDLGQEPAMTWAELRDRSLRPALIVGVGLAIFQQVTGINTIIYYAPLIFRQAGLGSNLTALAATSGIGLLNVLSTVIAIWLVDRAGRKPLLLTGLGGMTLSLIVLGATQRSAEILGVAARATAPLTVACMGLFIVCFAFSMGPIVWLLIAEIFPNRARSRAAAAATAANWMANFAVSLTFPVLRAALGPSLFFIYGAMAIAAMGFIAWRVPETRGYPLEEIPRLWQTRVSSGES